LRKVLLSNASNVTLPEGPPSIDELANMSAGVLQGFFGKGFEVDLNFTGNTSIGLSHSTEKAADHEGRLVHANGLEVHIDLHRCIARNIDYFRSVLRGLLQEIAAHDVGMKFSTAIMVPIAGLPDALRRCGLSEEDEEMLLGAGLSARGLHAGMVLPSQEHGNDLVGDRAAQLFEKAVHDWAAEDWFTLGQDLGKMLQGLLLSTLPSLYSIDGTGRLRHQLVGLSESRVHESLASHLGAATQAVLAMPILAVAAAAVVRYRGQGAAVADGCVQVDIEEAVMPMLDIDGAATSSRDK